MYSAERWAEERSWSVRSAASAVVQGRLRNSSAWPLATKRLARRRAAAVVQIMICVEGSTVRSFYSSQCFHWRTAAEDNPGAHLHFCSSSQHLIDCRSRISLGRFYRHCDYIALISAVVYKQQTPNHFTCQQYLKYAYLGPRCTQLTGYSCRASQWQCQIMGISSGRGSR